MKKGLRFIISILFLLVFIELDAFSMGSKQIIPMKTYHFTDIKDGEYLRYGYYNGGEKVMDYYYVTRIVTNGSGDNYYRLYMDIIPVSGAKNLPENYSNWPISALVDPVRAQTIEAEGNLNTNAMDDPSFSSFGFSGLFYFHYQLYRDKGNLSRDKGNLIKDKGNLIKDKGYIKYTSKSLKDQSIITTSYTINIKPSFPLMDAFSQDFISDRLIDPHSPGIMYFVVPNFTKEPLPVTFKIEKKDILTIKTGTFKVNKIIMYIGDPFLSKLAESFLKNSSVMVEDTDRRLPLKTQVQGYYEVLEEISNVIKH